jgi:hypothetical protein
MRPKTTELFNNSANGYFTFTAVRHPFDRVLSAFRDRILNGCTPQAKQYVPKIFKTMHLPVDKYV